MQKCSRTRARIDTGGEDKMFLRRIISSKAWASPAYRGFRAEGGRLEAICPPLCVVTFLFARPLYMAAHSTYGYASIYPDQAIKIPARADTSGIIRSSKQDCPDYYYCSVSLLPPFAGQQPLRTNHPPLS